LFSHPCFSDVLGVSGFEAIMVFNKPVISTKFLLAVGAGVRKWLILLAKRALSQA